MTQSSGAELPSNEAAPRSAEALPLITQWSRQGRLTASWSPYDTFESLVFTQELRTQLQNLAVGLLGSEDLCARSKLPWRRGAFLFGPAGCGKTAATKALALMLGWQHLTIPAHEILDAHLLAKALFDIPKNTPAVVVLENIDEIFKRVDGGVFFDVFDQVSAAANGVLWIATTRRSEEVPKAAVIRPGRFEERIRLLNPTEEVKKSFYEQYLEPFMPDIGPGKLEHLDLLSSNPQLSYAHLHEMRLLLAQVRMGGDSEQAVARMVEDLSTYCREQLIDDAERWGGAAIEARAMEERVKLADPRLLLSALQVTDAFKRIAEMTVTAVAVETQSAEIEKK